MNRVPRAVLAEAHEGLDLTGQVIAEGAAIAPDFVMRTIVGMRTRLDRHKPWNHPRIGWTCGACAREWPCPDVAIDLATLGVPLCDDDEP